MLQLEKFKTNKLIETRIPVPLYYRDGTPYDFEFIQNAFFIDPSGYKYFNLSSDFDAKLNLINGEAYPINHIDYEKISFLKVYELIGKGLLKCSWRQ